MYVWFGIKVDEQIQDLKNNVFKLCDDYNVVSQFKFHPAHISTKISFEIDEEIFESILNDSINYFHSLKPFEIHSSKIEIENDIIWLRWNSNLNLENIHKDLCDLVSKKYNIELHEFDYDYKFHTTLFTNSNKLNLNLVKEILNLKFPNKITVSEFFVGKSKDNKSENYKIYKSIKI